MNIKQELHALIDNLDVEKCLNSDVIGILYTKSKLGENFGFVEDSIFHALTVLLKQMQIQKEPTLEDKLIKAGFNQTGASCYFRRLSTYVFICEDFVKISVSKKGMDDEQLCVNKENHGQIFADITFLENRITKVQK